VINNQGNFKKGWLNLVDDISQGDSTLASAITEYTNDMNGDRTSYHWRRIVPYIENILFSVGRQYAYDNLISKLTQDASGNQSILEFAKNIPRPVNDLLDRYISPNISLLTENKPRPRVSPKSDNYEDIVSAEISELVLQYLWEALNMPEKHREIARLILHCGTCWMEVCWDPTHIRRVKVPQTTEEDFVIQIPGAKPVKVAGAKKTVTLRDKRGRPVFSDNLEYGDITSRVISPFEMYTPTVHEWNGDDMGWIMREYYSPIQAVMDKYGDSNLQKQLGGKRKGWYFDNLKEIKESPIHNLPIWWWERLSQLIEGPDSNIYAGTPETWRGYVLVRVFDRKPNIKWPRGRTIIVVGDKVLYDSPKSVGARAFDSRWPSRWHPYVRFRWEPIIGNLCGRSLVTKLLPKLKRINSIDTTIIMWRRTVPIAGWLVPTGAGIIEDSWNGQPGQRWRYDPIRTRGNKPEPISPTPYPDTAMVEREQQLREMDVIAGTQEILRGENPVGSRSGSMLEILRRQALSSKAPILQAWDESLEEEGSFLLQEVVKNIREDPRYLERLRVIAREKKSRLTLQSFSGIDLSDNVIVSIDTVSMASISKEAKEAKAIEVLQYAGGLMALPPGLRISLISELGWGYSLQPQGSDVERAKSLISWIKQGQFERVVPMPDDDPEVFVEILKKELQSDAIWDLDEQQWQMLIKLLDIYKKELQIRQQSALEMQLVLQGNKGIGQGEK